MLYVTQNTNCRIILTCRNVRDQYTLPHWATEILINAGEKGRLFRHWTTMPHMQADWSFEGTCSIIYGKIVYKSAGEEIGCRGQ